MRRAFRPDDEDKPFIARWNLFARILLVESSVKLVARAVMDYADFEDGSSCHPSNDRLARETGYNEKTIRFAWSVMRGLGMAKRVAYGVAHRRLADDYQLQIPDNWSSLPILGPNSRKFTCLGCQKLFTPQGNCTANELKTDPEDTIRFNLARMCFCPPPRRKDGRAETSCLDVWNRQQAKAGSPTWHERGQECWKLFRQARGDDW